MEDEDEVLKAVDPPTLEQSSSELPLPEPYEVPEQCATAESLPTAAIEVEAHPSPVAEGLAGEGEAVEMDEREHEGENAGELVVASEEVGKMVREGTLDDILKEELLPQVTGDLEMNIEEMSGGQEAPGEGIQVLEILGEAEVEGDMLVKTEEQLPATEKVRVVTTQDMPGGDQELVRDDQRQEVDKQEEGESKGVEEVAEEHEEDKSKNVEEDANKEVAVNEEEEEKDGSKGDEDLDGENEEDNKEMEGDGGALLVVKQEEDELKEVGGDVEGQAVVNEEENETKANEEMVEEKVEDVQEVGGAVEVQLVAEQDEDKPKGEGGEVGGQVKLSQDEDESNGDEEMGGEEDEFKGDEEMGEEEEAEEMDDDLVNGIESSPVVTKDGELTGEGGTPTADTEMETEVEAVKNGSGGKRRRGQKSKATPGRTPVRKTVGEDVCFICLDGGDLVLCDRRGCPKAYHPSCVDHDEEFFKTKDRWTCGWHLCNKCGKNAYFMCYTCTFSLCKGCCKDAVVFCVRGNRGFCESCMKTVMMIENSEQNEMGQVAFDDKSSWEYLFKDYWIEQKRRFSLTSDELSQARNPWKSSDATGKQQMIDESQGHNDLGTDSDNSENIEATDSKRKNVKRKSKSIDSDTDSSLEKDLSSGKKKTKRRLKKTKEVYSDSEQSSGNEDASNKKGKRPRRLSKSRSKDGSTARAVNIEISGGGTVEWASNELLEFVMHMKGGDKSVLTQFDVQGLLLEYIKINKLRDPRRRSQIICDPMLQKLFGKPRVGHFEMLKLLESHFLIKEDFQADDNRGSIVDDMGQVDADDNIDSTLDAGRSKGRKSRRRGEDRGLPSNLEDYAAIDMHNISLIYLRRSLMEALMENSETFHDKVVGSFVRIRISGSSQKQDIYRLVQIIGTSKAAEPYRVGKRTTDVMLEILNLDKTEIISIDSISNQEFTEDECKRLRQSIKCGLISRMTVGDVLEKARELQGVRVIDWLEAEIVRLNHLRDRASEKGRKKELRECVEKLQLLKTPEERHRRLEEIPEVHTDPKMDPSCESEDETVKDNKRQASKMRPRGSGFFRRDKDHFSSGKGDPVLNDSWSVNARQPSKNWELIRNSSGKGFSSRKEDTIVSQSSEHTWSNGEDKGAHGRWEKPRLTSDPLSNTRAEYSRVQSDMSAAEVSHPPPTGISQTDSKVSESEKMWSYRDPTGKIQGPFSMAQLRKWSNTGYFPADLRIWKASQTEDSFLLTEALAGRFQKESPSVGLLSDVGSKSNNASSLVESSKNSGHARGSEHGSRYDSSNLPSPTPSRSTAGLAGRKTSESKWSNTSSPFRPNNQFQGGNERLPSPTPTSPSSAPSSVDRSSFSQQARESGVAGNKGENFTASMVQPASINNSSGQFFSSPVPRPTMSLNSGTLNAQQISSQAAGHMANQGFAPADAVMNQANLRPNTKTAAQGFSNVVQPGAVQNPSVYTQGWGPVSVARPEIVNTNMMPGNVNTLAPQVPYGQWTSAPVANQASSFGAGYPPGPGNVTSNFPVVPSPNAWRPTPANMPWGGQPQQQMNPNIGWVEPPPSAPYGPPAGAMGQLAGPTPGASAMPSGNPITGWPGTGPNPTSGNANPGWVAPPGNTSTWGGDQNRRGGGGGGGGGGGQWSRQPSFGSGGGAGPGNPRGQGICIFFENGHCKKGSGCNYMHT